MDECNRYVLCFEHDNPNDFHKIVGQKSEKHSRIMIVFRVFELLYSYAMIIWIICTVSLSPHLKLYNSYCTWAQLLFSVSVEAGFGVVVEVLQKFKTGTANGRGANERGANERGANERGANERPKLPWYCKMYWAIFSAALPALVVSCVTYWTEIYEGKPEMIYIFMSTVTLLVILCEFFMIAFPLRLLYCYYFVAFILLYIIFSVIYQSVGLSGVNSDGIYKDLDWHKPERAGVTCVIGVSIGKMSFLIFWIINRMIVSRLFCKQET